ncbi:MAG: hypothetical protein J5988_03590 [Eubacterium sp.]|nr:hypothetical protein [Lachnospiraceae bacterium]MBO5486004.1 hypothetical protein [Eubacterium sp.]
MNNVIEIIPLVGINWEGKSVCLQAAREEIINILGTPYGAFGKSIYYFQNDLRIDFDGNGRAEFIEFLGGIDGKLQPEVYGVKAFEARADELFNILKMNNNGEINDNENGYSYGFLNISVGIFRERTPEDVREMIEEAEEEGEELEQEDLEYEKRKAEHWATIGIGVKGYYL